MTAFRLHSGRSGGPQISPKQPPGLFGLNVPLEAESGLTAFRLTEDEAAMR
ncbi:hypothetical protein X971_5002 (plasmid) [Agrobacterium tumefaciens LBA4213 (Ach5)]|nr:hypothetical protein X971_5002 [Agrobacterium tumefaciens LBA4213 (Ach5)]